MTDQWARIICVAMPCITIIVAVYLVIKEE